MPKKTDYTESKEIGKTHCPACPSSDGFTLYDDGHGYCFVCNHYERNVNEKESEMAVAAPQVTSLELFESQLGDCRGCKERGITKTIAEHYGVRASYDSERNITAYNYPYYRDNELIAYKVRTLPKQFKTVGDFKDVWPFGCQSFGAGGKRLVITEGNSMRCPLHKPRWIIIIKSILSFLLRQQATSKVCCMQENGFDPLKKSSCSLTMT